MARNHWPLALILAAFLLLGGLYSVVNPLFEAPDEVWHYEYVRWLVEGRGLPTPELVGEAPWHQEGSQPPLYYLAAALLTAPIPTDNATQAIRYNPHAAIGQPDSFGNKNVILHGRADSWPPAPGRWLAWEGVVLAAHLIRLFSLLLGAGTVLATYGAALAIFPGRPALASLAAALTAFNPQFLFLSAAVNNDNLVIAASAAGVWLLVHLLGRRQPLAAGSALAMTPALRTGPASILPREAQPEASTSGRQAAPTLGQLALLGLLVGVAALAKLSGLALAGLAGLTLLIIAGRRRSPGALIGWGLVVVVVAAAVAGWWYGRNWRLYGDPLGLQAMFEVLPRRPEPPTPAELLARAQGVWRSAWAVFGWFNAPADEWLYALYTALTLAGAAGLAIIWPLRLLYARWRNRSPARPQTGLQLLLLVVWVSVIFLALLNWAQMCYPQGRLFFPASGAAAILMALGLLKWLPARLHGALASLLAAGLLALAVLAPWRWIAPAYAPPALLPPDAAVANSPATDFGGQVRLVGYQMEEAEAQPGSALPLTLYWQALQPLATDYSVFVHLIDEAGLVQAQRDSYPAAGNFATGEWPTEAIVTDRHQVSIPETAPAPQRLRVDVGLYDYRTGQRLPTGDHDYWTLGYVTLLPRQSAGRFATVPNPLSVNFADQIELAGFDFERRVMRSGESLAVTLWWTALVEPPADYVVFVHLVLPPGATWAQSDAMPQAGAAPTSSWRPGQLVEDRHELALPAEAPPGVYFVEIGLYDPVTVERLEVNFSDKGVVLGQVRVE